MPGRTRSSQPRMFFGLPLRTTRVTTESVTMPLWLSWFHVVGTRPAFTSLLMSGSSENATTSAGCPAATARLCAPEAPKDSWNDVPLPAVVALKPGMRASYAFCGVEYATRLMVLEPPLFDAPAEEHAAVSAPMAASAAVARSGRDKWAKRI